MAKEKIKIDGRAETKRIVIQLEDWVDTIEAWEDRIYAFMVYGKDLLQFLQDQHPETAKAFLDARRTSKGRIERSPDYPSMVSFTDGAYFQQQIDSEKHKAEIKLLQELREKPNEYVEKEHKKNA
jgi:hypothetical protein